MTDTLQQRMYIDILHLFGQILPPNPSEAEVTSG